MTWVADGPARLVWPENSWMAFAINLGLVLAVILLITGIVLTIFARLRNKHWPWTYCVICENDRKRARAAKRLARRRR